ncbi:hypothetical protein ES702_06308 [subsurface metagenome]
MHWVVKLQRHGDQYRITLPRELIVKCGFEAVEYVSLLKYGDVGVMIEEYHGKRKEKRDLPEDQA